MNTETEFSLIHKLARKNTIQGDAIGVDIKDRRFTRKAKNGRLVQGNAKTMKRRQLNLNPKCKQTILLINNLLYMWIDNAMELLRFYQNMTQWLSKGSQIRIFPVYFGRYDMYNERLKKYLDKHYEIQILEPELVVEGAWLWDEKPEYVPKRHMYDEKQSNVLLESKTVVLTKK